MSVLSLNAHGNLVQFDEERAQAVAQGLRADYTAAGPFPHIVLDDFLPSEVIAQVEREFPKREACWDSFNREQERFKVSYDPNKLEPGLCPALFQAFNSRPFLAFLETLTGIKGLLPDPYFVGGGLHETSRGGKLAIHADFNLHQPLNLQRRLNLLVYLNHDWQSEYGGQLELWDRGMTRREKAVDPLFNRCVIFNTDDDSFHGHPDPLNCPPDRTRRSMALYYYTASPSIRHELREHTTDFRPRPGSGERHDVRVKADEWIRELLPPLVYRQLHRIKRKSQQLLSSSNALS